MLGKIRHALYITTGNILGWVFCYANSSSRSDFFVDIWRPVDNKQYRLVKATKITPNQEKTVEVIRMRVISIYYDYDYNVTLHVRLWGVNKKVFPIHLRCIYTYNTGYFIPLKPRRSIAH